jgi:hypothetical protein
MKIVICPLVSRDMRRSIRCVNSIRFLKPGLRYKFETVVVINSRNQEFITDFTSWCRKESVKHIVTPSEGTPSFGKNQVLEFFRNSDYDGLCMVDGDDLFYPSGALQIERHLLHHAGTDLLIVKPSDQVITGTRDNFYPINENTSVSLWGDNLFTMRYQYGPGKHEIYENRHAASNLGGHVFYSQKLVKKISYDNDQLLGEDLLFEFNALKLHQEGKISFWSSFASDVQLLDRTEQENIQSVKNGTDGDFYYERLISEINKFLDPSRSSFNEIPVEFPNMIFSFEEKFEFVKSVF